MKTDENRGILFVTMSGQEKKVGVQFSVRLPKNNYQRLQDYAAKHGSSVSATARFFLMKRAEINPNVQQNQPLTGFSR